jgi:methyltransferase (TIGR00027 family)
MNREMIATQISGDNMGNNATVGVAKGPNRLAERIAMIRAGESRRPEDKRVIYDPYAAVFIGPELGIIFEKLMASNQQQRDAMIAQMESGVPGLTNSTIARVRFFDDLVRHAVANGLDQLVILGAGYDTRAYRIEGMNKVRVFEVDQPDTQYVKIQRLEEIFGSLPANVSYVPLDLETNRLDIQLAESGYDPSKKTLFTMEGLIMYLDYRTVDWLLAFIVHNSGKGSSVAFDYGRIMDPSIRAGEYQESRAIARLTKSEGDIIKFAVIGTVEKFLGERGFSDIKDMDSKAYKRAYFHGKNAGRQVSSLLRLAYAVVE